MTVPYNLHHNFRILGPWMEWSGAYFLSYLFVNFNIHYNFWTVWDIRTSYLARILNLWNSFKWQQGRWPCDRDCDLCTF